MNAIAKYHAFLGTKSQFAGEDGFAPSWMPDNLFDFQQHLVDWAQRSGRSAIYADCGLGKTPIQLTWAENVVRKTNRPVLVLTPLAVAAQTVHEGAKFGIECRASRNGEHARAGIVVTNYEQLQHYSPGDFAGVVCDESSILKNFDGSTKAAVTEFVRTLPYRLLCTATAAPNDYVELGTSSEALGNLGHMDMLSRFFKNDTKTLHIHGSKIGDFARARWRFKAHAEPHFWRWVCSWARACRKPSDLGFDDGRFELPKLVTHETVVNASKLAPGFLFEVAAADLHEQRQEARRTLTERCEAAAARLSGDEPGVAWCQLNDESALLERLIPGAVQVTGSDEPDKKEEAFEAFARGQIRVLVSKPTIAGYGLNWQHCARMTFFPSHSFEQYYQAIRRCWRFGQTRPVAVDVITTQGGAGVLDNLNRKAEQAERMFEHLVALMNDALAIGRGVYGDFEEEIPAWLYSTN